jgi:hypothetical protein
MLKIKYKNFDKIEKVLSSKYVTCYVLPDARVTCPTCLTIDSHITYLTSTCVPLCDTRMTCVSRLTVDACM